MQTIGERLEDARKKKGISIREAAEATKIRGEYLQKFEGNQFEIGLTDIYTRGFLRGYANYLRLPSDRLLNDYTALRGGDGWTLRPRIRSSWARKPMRPLTRWRRLILAPGPSRRPGRRRVQTPGPPVDSRPLVIHGRW